MIVTDLEHAEERIPGSPSMDKALAFLRRPGLKGLPDGETELDGRRVFAIVQRYETAMNAATRFEFHKKYIDIQYIAAGAEVIGWAPAGRMSVSEPYDADKDICFGAVKPGEWSPLYLPAGHLAVLYPEDAHAPKLAAGAAGPVMKVVIKLLNCRR